MELVGVTNEFQDGLAGRSVLLVLLRLQLVQLLFEVLHVHLLHQQLDCFVRELPL